MSRYTLEKVLYFAKTNGAKGLHVAAREFRHGTDLASLSENAEKRGELTRVKMANGDFAFHITDKGEVALLRQQIAFRSNTQRPVGQELDALIKKRASMPDGTSALEHMKSLLEQASQGDIPRKKGMGVGELIDMQALRPRVTGAVDVWSLTDVGVAYLDALKSWFNPALRQTQVPDTAPPELGTISPDMNWQALDAMFPNRGGVFDLEIDNPIFPEGVPHPDVMVRQGLLTRLGEDDLQIYYALTNFGVDQLVRGLSYKPATNDAAYIKFDIAMTLSDYRREGLALAAKQLDPEALAGVNDLHWDVCHLERIPLLHAVKGLVDKAPSLRENSPAAIARKHETMQQIRGQLLERFGSALTLDQLTTVFQQECQKVGLPHSPEIARHYMQSHQVKRLDIAARHEYLIQPVDTMPVMTVAEERDYQYETPKLRPGR